MATTRNSRRLAWERDRLAKRQALLNRIKMERGCALCGWNKHPAGLDFDHVGDGKRFNIGSSTFHAWENVLAEIAKCRVLCACCHRIETFNADLYRLRGGRPRKASKQKDLFE